MHHHHRPIGYVKGLRPLLAAIGAAALATAWVLGPGPTEAATFTFKCATATLNDLQHEWCKRYAARLEKRSNGRIKAQVFPAGQLGSTPRVLEGIQLGTIEAHTVPPDFLVGIDPRFQILSAPFVLEDYDHAYRVLNDTEFSERFLALAESKGIKGVSLMPAYPASLLARSPIRAPDDVKGKKVRVLATPIDRAVMAALGATGVPMPLGEVMPALQQGAIDAVQVALPIFVAFKYYDVAKYHTNTNHYMVTVMGMVSKKWYDGLPPDLQQAVVEEGRADHAELLAFAKNHFNQSATTWEEKTKDGLIELTPEQRAAFRKRTEGVEEKVAEQFPVLKEWLELVRAKAKQHAK